MGVEDADKIASVIGAIVGIVGLGPAFYSVSATVREARNVDRKHLMLRSQFARHLVSELDSLANKEEWEDERYTELEAEVEMEGRRRRLFGSREQNLRRVRSLSVALARSSERLILLEGDPGSGKSMALRHTAQKMADQVQRRPTTKVIPLYVNLKAFRPQGAVTSGKLRQFIIEALNPQQNRSVDKFLEAEFDNGVAEGSWLFLFDSFDEIPAILSSTEADHVVEKYASAVQDLLDTMANCRGVLASREYRGPRRLGWPRFKIVRLSEARIRQLVSRWSLPADTEATLHSGLRRTHESVRDLCATPLFLSLLCQYMRDGNDFPENPHAVFEQYVSNRLTTDEARTMGKFQVSGAELRRAAEAIAFAMSDDPAIGLETTRGRAVALLQASGVPQASADRLVKAVVYTKLATATGPEPDAKFTFSHRRIQEFFATCIVLYRPDLVPADRLLTDHTWREAAVTILQTQSERAISPILDEATRQIRAEVRAARRHPDGDEFSWPPGLLHLLDLLAAGMAGRPDLLGQDVRQQISNLLDQVWRHGRRHDRLWLLQICGVATDFARTKFIQWGYESPGTLLREESYRQTGRLGIVPSSLLLYARQGLVTQWAEGDLRSQLPSVRAQIRRIENSGALLTALSLVVVLPLADLLLSILVGAVVVQPTVHADDLHMAALSWPLITLAGYVVVARISLEMIVASPDVSWTTRSPVTKLFQRVRDYVNGLFGRSEPSRNYWWLGVALRMGLVFVSVVLIVTRFETWWVVVALSIGTVYALVWAPFAIDLIVSTGSLRPWQWPLLPAVSIARGVGRFRTPAANGYDLGVKLLRVLRELVIGIGYAVLCGVAGVVAGAILLGIAWLVSVIGGAFSDGTPSARSTEGPASPSPAASTGASASPTASPSGAPSTATTPADGGSGATSDIPGVQDDINWAAGALWTMGIVVALAVVLFLARWLREALRYRSLLHQAEAIRRRQSDAELVALITRIRDDRQLREFIVVLRRQGELKRAPDAVKFLSDLAACAELSRGAQWKKLVVPKSAADPFKRWITARAGTAGSAGWLAARTRRDRGRKIPRVIRSVSEATIDEITRTVAETARPTS